MSNSLAVSVAITGFCTSAIARGVQCGLWKKIFEFLGIWLTLVAILGLFSQVSEPSRRVKWAVILIPVLWIIILIPNAQIWPIARQVGGEQGYVVFESGAELYAFRLHVRKRDLTVRLFLSPERWDYNGLGYTIDVVDQVNGANVVNRNTHAHRRLEFYLAPGYMPVYRQWKQLEFPPDAPGNRALWIVLKLWREENGQYVSQRVLASDLRLLTDTQVVLSELVIPAQSTIAPAESVAVFDKGFTLDAVTLPETARAGETLTIDFGWRSAVQGSEDHVQFMHFVHVESGQWWGYDQQPLGARLPTRLWYSGLADNESWQVPLPADLAPGLYSVFTGLYRTRDQERIPANDADGTPWLDARVALGTMRIDE